MVVVLQELQVHPVLVVHLVQQVQVGQVVRVVDQAVEAVVVEAEAEARAARSEAEGEANALRAEVAALARLVEREALAGSQLLDRLEVEPGFEKALGAALADDLRAPEVDGAGRSGWPDRPPVSTRSQRSG